MKSKPVEFRTPDGFVLPEGTEAGEDFDVVCTLRAKNNGTLCLVKLGDVDMPGYADREDKSERPEYGQARDMMTGGETTNGPMMGQES